MQRGEIWWAQLPEPMGTRPVLLLSRDKAIQVRKLVTVAIVTAKARDIPAEVPLSKEDGMPKPCVVNADVLYTVVKVRLRKCICRLSPEKMIAVRRAVKFALGFD